MMVKPGITELDRCVDSRYTLVSMAAKRARMIGAEQSKFKEGKEPKDLKDITFEKPVTLAVEEIANGKVGYVRSEALKQAERYEQEKYEAIISYVEKENAAAENEETEAEQPEENEDISDEVILDDISDDISYDIADDISDDTADDTADDISDDAAENSKDITEDSEE